MAEYLLSAEGSYTLSDLREKLQSITDWDWDKNQPNSDAFKDGEPKFHEALNVYESIKTSLSSKDPTKRNKVEFIKLANVWDEYASEQYKVPREGIENM
jgi:hypothetical protein